MAPRRRLHRSQTMEMTNFSIVHQIFNFYFDCFAFELFVEKETQKCVFALPFPLRRKHQFMGENLFLTNFRAIHERFLHSIATPLISFGISETKISDLTNWLPSKMCATNTIYKTLPMNRHHHHHHHLHRRHRHRLQDRRPTIEVNYD